MSSSRSPGRIAGRFARSRSASPGASDLELVRGLAGEDAQACARSLYRSYGAELYGFAVKRLGDAHLAEELVQDVFTRAWRSARQYSPERGSVRTWLYAIARNALVDAERRRGRRPPAPPQHDVGEVADPQEPIELSLLRYQIQLALSRLTFEHRQVLILAHFRGLSVAEIASLTGLPEGTVKSRLHYAARNLRLALEELGLLGAQEGGGNG
jgi:RNA polymerase sigma-70 factor (ECF subfamily)